MIARIARLRPGQQGSSLIEATLALGLMAAVLGSIAGLFMLGAGRVKSGRVSSEALAVARTILEEIESRNFRQTYEELGYDGTASSYIADTRTNTGCADWQSTLSQKLHNGYATIAVSSLDPGAPIVKSSTQLRVMVTVYWQEGTKQRSVRVGTVRM